MRIFLIWFGFIGRLISRTAYAAEESLPDYDETKKKVAVIKEERDKQRLSELPLNEGTEIKSTSSWDTTSTG